MFQDPGAEIVSPPDRRDFEASSDPQDEQFARRIRMVERQLVGRGIRDKRVLEAMAAVPRERFVPDRLSEMAYCDGALPLTHGQTISQPYIVALTIEALTLSPLDRVLEIGTGSGYSAAVISRVADQVYSVERLAELADTAAQRLAELGYDNVQVACRDGTLGWPEQAPFDAIAVTAGGPRVPRALIDQLAPGGRMVIPVGGHPTFQQLVRIRLSEDGTEQRDDLGAVRFVPLVGEQGWQGES
jgi:protein-L-isoaspartate(D-aspartate) O-methyltransferase